MDMGLWELIEYCWEVLFGIFFIFLIFSAGFVMFAIVEKIIMLFQFFRNLNTNNQYKYVP
jgi:hypothetical protein